MNVQLQFRDLTLGYDRHPAVHHLNGAVEAGALVAVVGPNGAGKSTLFKGIVGVIKPSEGRIDRGGLAPQDIAYLPQAAEIDRSFPIGVLDMVAMGLWRRSGAFGAIDRAARASIERAIAAVGLPGFEGRGREAFNLLVKAAQVAVHPHLRRRGEVRQGRVEGAA